MPQISRVDLDGVNVTSWVDLDGFRPGDLELGQPVSTVTIPIVDVDATIPIEPRYGREVAIYDETVTLVFGGWVGNAKADPVTGARRWDLDCHDWNVRLAETSTGSLNQAGVLLTDREFVISIFRDALKAQTFGAATGLDDSIITANEPDWPGVQGTAVISGADWSYKSARSAMATLVDRVPNVFWRVRPDKILEYGIPNSRAAIAFVSFPSSIGRATLVEYDDYSEEELVGGHVNKLRRGAIGAAEATAFDEVSYARFGRIIEGPYKNDESIPAGDVQRLAYAELHSHPVRRVIRLRTADAPAVTPGQTVPVVCDTLGAYEPDGGFPDVLSIDAPSPAGEPVDSWRGEFVVQRVAREMLGPSKLTYEVELGDYVPEFSEAVAAAVTG